MRRLFVIFLILLFPLNVLALSLSASSMQADGVHTASTASTASAVSVPAAPGDSLAGQAGGDIDPDEPPASGDFHESVDEHSRLRVSVLPAWSMAPYARPLHDHPSFAPVKPPPRG